MGWAIMFSDIKCKKSKQVSNNFHDIKKKKKKKKINQPCRITLKEEELLGMGVTWG